MVAQAGRLSYALRQRNRSDGVSVSPSRRVRWLSTRLLGLTRGSCEPSVFSY